MLIFSNNTVCLSHSLEHENSIDFIAKFLAAVSIEIQPWWLEGRAVD